MSTATAVDVRPFTMHLHHDGVLRPGTRRLGPHEALKLRRAQGELRVLEGSVWLTRSSDAHDYLLDRGETFRVNPQDIVVIEAARTGERALVLWDCAPAAPWRARTSLAWVVGLVLVLLVTVTGAHAADGFDRGVREYRAGHFAAAWGRFYMAANDGDPDAARMALHMLHYGPWLYGGYWDAGTEEEEYWVRLAGSGKGRRAPDYQPPKPGRPSARK